MRTKIGASLTLLGWKKNEIENNLYFLNLLKLFGNVYFIGYGNSDESWQSIGLIVSDAYQEIYSLDDL